jgi:hypothetical protein
MKRVRHDFRSEHSVRRNELVAEIHEEHLLVVGQFCQLAVAR